MTRSRITATLSYPVERVWDTVTNLHDIRWRSDLQAIKVIDESTFIEVTTQGRHSRPLDGHILAVRYDDESRIHRGYYRKEICYQTLCLLLSTSTAKALYSRPQE